jgi:hypothetical protein
MTTAEHRDTTGVACQALRCVVPLLDDLPAWPI